MSRATRGGAAVAVRRVILAAVTSIAVAAPWQTGAAAEPANPPESLWERTATVAGQAYDMLQDGAIDPAFRAADAALSSPTVGQAYGKLARAARSTAAMVDDAALRPLSQAARDALNSPAAQRSGVFASAIFDGVAAGMRRYVVDPSRELMEPAPGRTRDRSSLDDAPGQARLAAVVPPPRLTPPPPVAEADDPFEFVNRRTFALNNGLRSRVLDPITALYRGVTPPMVQQRVENFFANLREPLTIASSLLEGEVGDAGNATARFGINTTIGVLGFNDPATSYGFARRSHNLEEVLCTYGIPSGPYLVLPLYGPATVRDAVGRLATVVAYFEVMGIAVYVPYRVGDAVAQSAAAEEPSAAADDSSPNSYVMQRSLYLEARNAGCGHLAAPGATSTGY